MTTLPTLRIEHAARRYILVAQGTDAMQPMNRPQHRRDVSRIVLAGWLSVLVILSVCYVSLVWHTSDLQRWAVTLAVVAIVAGSTTVVLGGVVGYRRDWRFFLTALLTGTGILVAALEAAWVATFFVPVPGGSGGFGEIIAPALIAILGGAFSFAAISALLGGGVVIGIAIDLLRRQTSEPRLPIT
jgi:hypothetical protein